MHFISVQISSGACYQWPSKTICSLERPHRRGEWEDCRCVWCLMALPKFEVNILKKHSVLTVLQLPSSPLISKMQDFPQKTSSRDGASGMGQLDGWACGRTLVEHAANWLLGMVWNLLLFSSHLFFFLGENGEVDWQHGNGKSQEPQNWEGRVFAMLYTCVLDCLPSSLLPHSFFLILPPSLLSFFPFCLPPFSSVLVYFLFTFLNYRNVTPMQ